MKLIVFFITGCLLLFLGCSKPCFVDKAFLSVNDNVTYEYVKNNLDRVQGVDVEIYKMNLDSNLVVLYSFFSEKLYAKSWVYYIDSSRNLETYFPELVYCRTENCISRLEKGEEVLLGNYNNNQFFSCTFYNRENKKPRLRFHYMFKQLREPR